jgi:hypothetical protein
VGIILGGWLALFGQARLLGPKDRIGGEQNQNADDDTQTDGHFDGFDVVAVRVHRNCATR